MISPPRHSRLLILVPCLLAAWWLLMLLSGCMREPLFGARPKRVVPIGAPVEKGGGHTLIGKPYLILGRLFVPRADPNYDQIGLASVLSPEHHGTRSANGEVIDLGALVAAHPTLPLPSYVEVTNLENQCSLIVRLNDRGPFVYGRLIDVTPKVAALLRFERRGLVDVRVRYLTAAPLDGDDSYETHFKRRFPSLGCIDVPLEANARSLAPARPRTPVLSGANPFAP